MLVDVRNAELTRDLKMFLEIERSRRRSLVVSIVSFDLCLRQRSCLIHS
jgi:hypothetical protein